MSNVQLIYKQLRDAGVSEAGALGLMGNWMAESGLEPGRLQGDFTLRKENGNWKLTGSKASTY